MTKKELLEQLEDFPDSTEIYVADSEWGISHEESQVIKDVLIKNTNGVSELYVRLYR